MKRTSLIKSAIVLQSLIAVLVVGMAAYVLWLSRSPQILSEPDAADAVHGLRVGAAVTAIPGMLLLAAAIGLWLGKRWSWWLALATDVLVFATLAYNSLTENSVEWDEVALTMCFLLPAVFLALPSVRAFYLQKHKL
jgi:hypothetical protein